DDGADAGRPAGALLLIDDGDAHAGREAARVLNRGGELPIVGIDAQFAAHSWRFLEDGFLGTFAAQGPVTRRSSDRARRRCRARTTMRMLGVQPPRSSLSTMATRTAGALPLVASAVAVTAP